MPVFVARREQDSKSAVVEGDSVRPLDRAGWNAQRKFRAVLRLRAFAPWREIKNDRKQRGTNRGSAIPRSG